MDFAGFTIRSFRVVMLMLAFVTWSCWASCPDRQHSVRLILDNFKGTWYLAAATPTSGNSVSKCANLKVMKTSANTFSMNFTALSRRNNRPVTFNMNGEYKYADINGTWQLKGSKRILGPFIHRIVTATEKYDTVAIMVVCAENRKDIPLREFGMILSRENTISTTRIAWFKEILRKYFPIEQILNVDHTDCGKIY